jgi:hypothetical protein
MARRALFIRRDGSVDDAGHHARRCKARGTKTSRLPVPRLRLRHRGDRSAHGRLPDVPDGEVGPLGGKEAMKNSEKPKKLQKKQPQKTLKQRRSEKRAAPKKYGSV